MADDNRPLKYMRYAIGEIVLVVIGILIALQINNWNELKKFKKKEKVFLKEIISDLNFNQNSAQIELENSYTIGRDSIAKTFDYIIHYLENKSPYHDSLSIHFNILHQLPTVNIKVSGFESLKATGMDIIQKDSLRSSIGEYYTATISRTEDSYTELRDDFYNYILKFPRTLFVTKKDKNQRNIQIPINYGQLLENVEYVESLKMFKGIYVLDLNITKEYLNQTEILTEKIEEYLNEN